MEEKRSFVTKKVLKDGFEALGIKKGAKVTVHAEGAGSEDRPRAYPRVDQSEER